MYGQKSKISGTEFESRKVFAVDRGSFSLNWQKEAPAKVARREVFYSLNK